MGDRIHALAQQLTGKDRLEECSIEELRHIANRHPYFAPAQFLLLQKLRLSGTTEEAEAQYRKAVLYYHDPLLFEQFIASNKFYTEELQAVAVSHEPVLEEEGILSERDVFEVEEPVAAGDPIEETSFVEDNTVAETKPDNLIEEAELPDQSTSSEIEETERTEPVTQDVSPTDLTGQIELPVPDDEETNRVEDTPTPPAAPVLQTEMNPATDQELTFEPYHTVDYFASQGIKVSQDEQPKDKLGKQLKSFTEWLKTMKRLPAAQAAQNVESSAEKKVESLADRSVSESDVVTEAMAEVWLKQGNTGKALDIYNKLSLLNPSKKAYFAAKIENLKQS